MTPLDIVRFWARVDTRGTGCWEWTGPRTPRGYGLLSLGVRPQRRTVLAHRLALELHRGEALPDGLVVDHLCRTPSCCRPDHLQAVTQALNVRRGRLPKLRPEQVEAIRQAHAEGASQYALARTYSVSQPTISRICTGALWSPTQEPTS